MYENTVLVCLCVVLLILIVCRGKESMSNVSEGTFSSVLFYNGEGYIVMLRDTDDSLPEPSRYFKSNIFGTDQTLEVARSLSNKTEYLINYVGNNFIAAPIRMRGGDPLTEPVMKKIRSLERKKIKGKWKYVGKTNREAPESIFKIDKPWTNALKNKVYKISEGKMPYDNIVLN